MPRTPRRKPQHWTQNWEDHWRKKEKEALAKGDEEAVTYARQQVAWAQAERVLRHKETPWGKLPL